MIRLSPRTLRGEHVVLAPLAAEHAPALVAAAADGAQWEAWYTNVPRPAEMAAEIERRLALARAGAMLPFAVVEPRSGDVVGMTTFMNVDVPNRRVEIGSTWYARSVQRTALNTEAKLLLLREAFETFACIAVEFRTSAFNRQSRAAIERLGAHLDGVLRAHRVTAEGFVTDVYAYSILAAEWPAVSRHLRDRLARGA